MQNHLLVCKAEMKNPCVYCEEKIRIKDEESHLLKCKAFQTIQSEL